MHHTHHVDTYNNSYACNLQVVYYACMIGSMMDGFYHAHAALLSLKPDGLPLWKYFFYVQTGLGWVYGTAGLTGCCLLIILTIMVLCSLPCVRRKGYFEVSTQSMIRRKGVESAQGSLHHFERWGVVVEVERGRG